MEDVVGIHAGDVPAARWEIDSEILGSPPNIDLRGPQIHGRPGRRFIYLTWGTVSGSGAFTMFRRAKLSLDAVPDDVMQAATQHGSLIARLGLSDDSGWPVCAAIRPPRIDWSAA